MQSCDPRCRLRWLAALRLPRAERPGAARRRGEPETVAALVLLHPRERRAEEARSRHRAGVARPPARASKTIYRRWQELEAGVGELVSGREAGRDGVQPAERQPVHRPRRCRHHRTREVVRLRGRPVRRPDPALRGDLGRRSGEVALRGREAVPRGVRCRVRVHRRRDPGEGQGDGDRGAGADHGALRRQQA